MKLGRKILLAIVLSFIFMFCVTYWGSLTILKSSYTKLENKEAKIDINNVQEALNALTTINSTAVLAFANWDTFYALMIDTNPVTRKEFLDANFALSSLSIYNLDFALVYNTEGLLVISLGLNQDRSALIAVPADILKLFQPKQKFHYLVTAPPADNVTSGLILTEHGIAIIGSNNLSDTAGKAPSRGTLIFGQYLNEAIWNKLKASTKLDMTLYPLPVINQNSELKNEYTILLKKENDQVILNDKILNLYTLVRDIHHTPIGMIKINMQRGIHQLGLKTIYYFNLAFLATGIFLALILFYLLRKIVTKRFEEINNKMITIEKTKKFNLRVPEEGNDEISSIGKKTNEILILIEEIEIFFTDIINSMPSALIMVDKNLRITNMNQLAEKESNLLLKNAKGKLLVEIFPFLSESQDWIRKTIQNKKPQEISKIPLKTLDNMRYFNAVIYPLRGNEQRLAIRLDDITEMIEVDQRQAETAKLVSIGILTAGVAHEIKNPINFISGAVLPLQRDLQDIISLLDKYAEITSKSDYIMKINEIEMFIKEIDFDSTLNEVDKLINSIKEGSNRIVLIVENLKLFSAFQEDNITEININLMLDMALKNLQNDNVNPQIIMKKDYSDIPQVSGFSIKLIQAFTNILTNAVNAIAEEGIITLKTEIIPGFIKICIRDTGVGISDENLSKIFDPFFTTREVGKGIGLGLSTAASIIRDHNGIIEVKSKLGEGTEVIILIPIDYSTESSKPKNLLELEF